MFLNGCLVVRIYLRRGIRDGNDRTAKGLGIAPFVVDLFDCFQTPVLSFPDQILNPGIRRMRVRNPIISAFNVID